MGFKTGFPGSRRGKKKKRGVIFVPTKGPLKSVERRKPKKKRGKSGGGR